MFLSLFARTAFGTLSGEITVTYLITIVFQNVFNSVRNVELSSFVVMTSIAFKEHIPSNWPVNNFFCTVLYWNLSVYLKYADFFTAQRHKYGLSQLRRIRLCERQDDSCTVIKRLPSFQILSCFHAIRQINSEYILLAF